MKVSKQTVWIIPVMVLAMAITPRILGKTDRSGRYMATVFQLAGFKSALGVYQMDLGDYPTQLSALTLNQSEDPRYKGPYLEADGVPRDAWGEEFCYQYADARTGPYSMFSKGKDKLAGTADDVWPEGDQPAKQGLEKR